MKSTIIIKDGTANETPVRGRNKGQIVERNRRALAVKWPSGYEWPGDGYRDRYPSETVVYLIDSEIDLGDGRTKLNVDQLIAWEHTRKKKSGATAR